jgi:hypothetical protein
MPGRRFDPAGADGFVGLCLVPGARPLRRLPRRLVTQCRSGARVVRAVARAAMGHTALACGAAGRVQRLVGWAPASPVDAFVKRGPIAGVWRDDAGMDADPAAVWFGAAVSPAQHEQFLEFVSALVGRDDLGAPLAEAGVTLAYAARPHDAERRSPDPLAIVANSGDAAFHVLATFFYEWGMRAFVDEMRAFVLRDDLTRNFSQGMLVRWAGEG